VNRLIYERQSNENLKNTSYGTRNKKSFSAQEAREIAKVLGIDFSKSGFDAEQFRMGLDTELEHGRRSYATNVTNDNPILTGRIALAHLNEYPDYYTRLKKLEDEAKAYWGESG
jgi:hypothetical protein